MARDETPKEKADRLTRALENFRFSARTYKAQRQRETEYLKFQVPELQWPKDIRDYRQSQFGNQGVPMPPDPTLSISMIDEPIALVENQFNEASLEPNVIPRSEDATDDTAQVLTELNRQIDVDPESRATNARNWAFKRTLRAGLGWYYIDKVFDRASGHPFDQKLLVKRVLYQDGIFPDPTAQEPDWSDGLFLHDVVDLIWEKYKGKYPKSKLSKYTQSEFHALGPEEREWVPYAEDENKRVVRVSNYWRVEVTTRTHVLLNDGTTAYDDEIPDGKARASDDDVAAMHYTGLRDAPEETYTVYRSVINGVGEELEDEIEWDGSYIPYVPTIGIELQPFEGERRWTGMVANAMDGQRLVNYAASQAVKLAAMEPQAPWQGEEGVFEGHEQEYAQSNTRKFPFLQYKPTNSSGQRATPPARVQVDTSRLGPSMQLLGMGKDFVESATFTYGPARGEQTPAHRSGEALKVLTGQTTQGTSFFLDNLANISLPLEMKIKLDLIPAVYDRPGRVVQILTGEHKPRRVMLNQPFTMHPQTQQPTAAPMTPQGPLPDGMQFFDLSQGRYGVNVTIGKQSDARVLEGSDAVGRLMESDPSLLPVLGPVWAKFQTFPGSKSVEQALLKWQHQVAPWMTDNGQSNQNAQQQVQQLHQQLQQLQQAAQQMQAVIQGKQIESQARVQIEQISQQTQILLQQRKDATQIEVARITAAKEGIIADREAAEERLATGLRIVADAATQEIQHGHEATQAALDRHHELATTGLEHGAAIAASAQEHQQALEQSRQENAQALAAADAQRQQAEAQPAQPAASPSAPAALMPGGGNA